MANRSTATTTDVTAAPAFEPNPDAHRREQLLALETPIYRDGSELFSDLHAIGLKSLIEERFIDTEARRFSSPSAGDFLCFMERWPQVLAHGFATDPDEPYAHVVIEGLECDLIQLPVGARDLLRQEFAWFCGDATEYFDEADYVYAAWR